MIHSRCLIKFDNYVCLTLGQKGILNESFSKRECKPCGYNGLSMFYRFAVYTFSKRRVKFIHFHSRHFTNFFYRDNSFSSHGQTNKEVSLLNIKKEGPDEIWAPLTSLFFFSHECVENFFNHVPFSVSFDLL